MTHWRFSMSGNQSPAGSALYPGRKRVVELMSALGVQGFAAKTLDAGCHDIADKLVELCVARGIAIPEELWDRK